MKPPDLSRMKAEVATMGHKPWCPAQAPVVEHFKDGTIRVNHFVRRCTCGLSAMRERIERIEGMAMDAGKEAN